jgi:hypothetical protein
VRSLKGGGLESRRYCLRCTRRARRRAADIGPTIKELQASGATSSRAIAAALNDRGITTARGDQWTAMQVQGRVGWVEPFAKPITFTRRHDGFRFALPIYELKLLHSQGVRAWLDDLMKAKE